MSARVETWVWIVQRATAAILALAVVVHLVTIIYAVRHGLTAGTILARTSGNPWWLGFYLIFATAASLHAGAGLRVIAREMTSWRGVSLDGTASAVAFAILVTGWRAAIGLFA